MDANRISGERKKMEPAEIAQFGRNLSVMVRVEGPDPKGLKMRRSAFHLHQSGRTTLSASGLLVPSGSLAETPPIIDHVCEVHKHSGAVVVTCASVVEPFLITEQRNDPRQLFSPKLIHDAHIDVLFEGGEKGGDGVAGPHWVPTHLLAVVDVPASSAALRSLIGVQSGSLGNPSWEVGWSLAPLMDNLNSETSQRQVGNDIGFTFESRRNFASEDSSNSTHIVQPATRIAFLGVSSLDVKGMPCIEVSQPQKSGDLLLVIGSPFGILSPFHFFNSVSVGAVANCCSQGSHHCALVMADVRCLPGMEGGPVFDQHARLTGILTRPLKQKGGNAEIQLVIPWDAIATVWGERLHKEAQSPNRNPKDNDTGGVSTSPGSPSMSQLSLEKVLSSIVLVTVDGGAWASGVLLNNQGLILTNAHLLEPWRFDKTSLLGLNKTTTSSSTECERYPFKLEGNHGQWRDLLPGQLENSKATVNDECTASLLNLGRKSYNIAVRLDDKKCHIWCGARVVYVSRGPFDVALLQLDSLPFRLRAITPEFAHPTAGSNVHVIGHGLFGPRSVLGPSVSSGVLASVVRLPGPLHNPKSTLAENKENFVPVMLQTTAAVHPGASGGAVVNSEGHMIGLVTSNAKHGGGTIIPNMNFSISCAALKPIFEFSEKQDMSMLHVLDKPNELLTAVWALTPPSSSRQQSFIDNKEGRGSRFARFLSERQTDFGSLKMPGDNVIEKPSDVFRRSKL